MLKKKRQEERYDHLPSDNVVRLDGELIRVMQQQGGGPGSYQHSGVGFNSMGTNEQKTVTYCMIDGRLLDE